MRSPAGGQPVLHGDGVTGEHGDEDRLGDELRVQVVLLQHGCDDFRVGPPFHAGHVIVLASHQFPVTDAEDHATRVVVGGGEGGDVAVGTVQINGGLPLAVRPQSPDPVAENGGVLEPHVLCQVRHLSFQSLNQGIGLPFQHACHLIDHRTVGRSCDESLTRPLALPYVVVEADPHFLLPDELLINGVVAAPDHEEVAHRLQCRTHVFDVGVGSEIAGTVADDSAGDEHTREWFIRDDDVGIALVVLQCDVVAGLELLDQIGLEDQGLHFRGGDDDLEVGCPGEHPLDARVERAGLLEILPDACPEILRLPHVQHFSRGILVLIDAG